jgi:hypothetical protein|tara:strand:+ start:568 stop:843 length:276 start_codon:yes stop_codon:yes gene_type:complete
MATASYGATTVTTNATAITGVKAGIGANDVAVMVPAGGTTTYIGFDNSVTTSNGFELAAGQALALEGLDEPMTVFGIVGSGSQSVRFVKVD